MLVYPPAAHSEPRGTAVTPPGPAGLSRSWARGVGEDTARLGCWSLREDQILKNLPDQGFPIRAVHLRHPGEL